MTLPNLPPMLPEVTAAVQKLRALPAIQKGLDLAVEQQELRIEEQIYLTEVPAPPFHEDARAAAFMELLKKYGLEDVKLTPVKGGAGNVTGVIRGTDKNGPRLVLAAHLDSVFPEGTEIKVRREGTKFHAPGISDDTDGLACLLQVIRMIQASGLKNVGEIVIGATVGEEGNGDIRGSKAMFSGNHGIDGFITVDDASPYRILHSSTGSKRFRVTFNGAGGHSFHKFGINASAIHAMCRMGNIMADWQVPEKPITTFTIGVIEGGTGVNSIAASCSTQVDLRSSDNAQLDILTERLKEAVAQAEKAENERWGASGETAVKATIEPIGDRPAGTGAPTSPVLQASRAAMDALGIELKKYSVGSTDHNIPLMLGIPATTLGGGGSEDNNHALNEWWDCTDAFLGPQLVFLTALALVGVDGTPGLLPKRG